jgi:hypothetical protein
VDGQEIYFQAVAGQLWHLRYRSGASGSYKWEFLGGGYVGASANGATGVTSSTYQTTGQASLTLPAISGDWEFTISGLVSSQGSGTNNMRIGLHDDGAEVMSALFTATAQYGGADLERSAQLDGIGASSVMTLRYKTENSVSSNFTQLRIIARPVRVG